MEKINTYRLFHAANLQAFRAKGLKIDVNILFIKSNSNFERQFAGARDNRSFVNRLTDGASDYYYIYRAAWPDDEFLIRASDSPALCWPRRWLRGWDFCFCFPSPGHSLCPAIFMHGHLARKFVGRWNISFVLAVRQAALDYFAIAPPAMLAQRKSLWSASLGSLFLSALSAFSVRRLGHAFFHGPLKNSACPFRERESAAEPRSCLCLPRVFLCVGSAFQLTRATPI